MSFSQAQSIAKLPQVKRIIRASTPGVFPIDLQVSKLRSGSRSKPSVSLKRAASTFDGCLPTSPPRATKNRLKPVMSQENIPETSPQRLSSTPSSSSLRSPRSPSSRQPSVSQSSMVDLLTSPPRQDGTFLNRDWRTITCKEIIGDQELRFIDVNTPVEEACERLVDLNLSSLPIKNTEGAVVGTFDYSDLTAFLLMVLGLWKGDNEDEENNATFQDLAKRSRDGGQIPVKLVKDLGKKDPFTTVSENDGLSRVVGIFGGGVHRVAVVREGTENVIGVISQLRLVTFFWEHGRSFPSIEQLYPCTLRDINIGSTNVISINGDKRVSEALELMNSEGITSLAVVDSQHNVVGNISTADVKHLTRASSLPLLRSSCLHFLSVILSDRGLNDGKDSFPVFHVSPLSTLAHTVAKLVATRAHRMWIVEAQSPASSAPPTPTVPPATTFPPASMTGNISTSSGYQNVQGIVPSALPAGHLSGRLIGVISLTDILNYFGRSSGLSPYDPNEARKHRRRSSSSSVRASLDVGRSSFDPRRI